MITINGYTFWMESGEMFAATQADLSDKCEADILTKGKGRAEAHRAWAHFAAEAA